MDVFAMKTNISDNELEAYVAGRLSDRGRRRIDTALRASANLRTRLEEVQRERETLEAVRDSFAIRLPEQEEERIISTSLGRLGTTLGEPGR
jgi:anti-sigma factor RsiW